MNIDIYFIHTWIVYINLRKMAKGCVGYIKLRKNGSGLGRIYQVEEERIRVGSDIYQFEKNGSGLGRIYQVLEERLRVGSDILV